MTATIVTVETLSFFACVATCFKNGAATVEMVDWNKFRLVRRTVTGFLAYSFARSSSSRAILDEPVSWMIIRHMTHD